MKKSPTKRPSLALRQNMVVRLQGKTCEDRHSVTAAASDAVGEAGGYILDYMQFSNLAVCFTIELPPAGFAKLRKKLADLRVILEAPSDEEMGLTEGSTREDIPGSLRIDFHHQEPDLRIPIAAVPG